MPAGNIRTHHPKAPHATTPQRATRIAFVALALWTELAGPESARLTTALAERIRRNDFRMATGFLGTKPLLSVLTDHGQHDLAMRLYQSRRFPSWGYEVVNGANTVWERWDSFTKERGFDGDSGKNNAAMNSFSHYSFGAVNEWAFRQLAGIDTDGPGYQRIVICPQPPGTGSNPEQTSIHWVRARYDSPRGRIVSAWRRNGDRFELEVEIPANTTASIHLPAAERESIRKNGRQLEQVAEPRTLAIRDGRVRLDVGSGQYHFETQWPSPTPHR